MIKNLKTSLKSNFEIKLLFILVSFFYYLIPILVILFDQQSNFFSSQEKNSTYFLDLNFSVGFAFLIFLNFSLFTSIFIFVLKNIYKESSYDKNFFSNTQVFNLLVKILLIFISAFLIFDILKLILFISEYTKVNEELFTSKSFDIFFKTYREEIKGHIFTRRTHYKILIILSVYYYAIDKKLSLFFYILICIVNLLAFSRFEIIQLFILHSLVNLKFLNLKKAYLAGIIIILFLLIFYRYLIFLKNDFTFITLFSNFFGDGNSTFLTNFIFYENLKDLFGTSLPKTYSLELTLIYLNNIWNYLLTDFFYQSRITIDFLSHNKFQNFTFSSSPPLEFFLYLPLLILYILIFKIAKKSNFLDNKRLFNIILLTLLLFSFRGSWIHEFGFLIKFILLMKFIMLISKFSFLRNYVEKNN
tara:strand:+ start:2074 stop:3321 length:1248 start_codon:yes stop_codon:yes gene_type:complete